MEACKGGHLAVVELLLKQGAAVHTWDKVCVFIIVLTKCRQLKSTDEVYAAETDELEKDQYPRIVCLLGFKARLYWQSHIDDVCKSCLTISKHRVCILFKVGLHMVLQLARQHNGYGLLQCSTSSS